MNKLTEYTYIAAFSSLLLVGGPLSAQSMTINIFKSTETISIDNWINGLGGSATVVEDFEDVTPGWYDPLDTDVGTFAVTKFTQAGTGSTSYANNGGHGVDDEIAFQVRDVDANGRKNTTPGDTTNYLDSADISELVLDVKDNTFSNLFFYITDPGDVNALTSIGTPDTAKTINYSQNNGSTWFVGINGEGDYISQITWNVTLTDSVEGAASTNDGFGLDDFSTVTHAPEPATMLLFGAGLAGLAGLTRRKRQ